MFNLFKQTRVLKSSRNLVAGNRNTQLQVESLCERAVPTAFISGGNLVIEQTIYNDVATVEQLGDYSIWWKTMGRPVSFMRAQ